MRTRTKIALVLGAIFAGLIAYSIATTAPAQQSSQLASQSDGTSQESTSTSQPEVPQSTDRATDRAMYQCFDPQPMTDEVCRQANEKTPRKAGFALAIAAFHDAGEIFTNEQRRTRLIETIRDTCPNRLSGIQAGIAEATQREPRPQKSTR